MNSITDWWQQLLQALRREPLSPPPPTHPVHNNPATPDVLEDPPMVGDVTLRDWMIHHHIRNADVWQAVVAEFYNRAAQDDEIAAYFAGVEMQRLQRHFMGALVVVTHIGLTQRKADDLGRLHAHLHITGEHFDRVVGVLVNVLTDYGVPRVAIPQLGNIAAALRRRIVTP